MKICCEEPGTLVTFGDWSSLNKAVAHPLYAIAGHCWKKEINFYWPFADSKPPSLFANPIHHNLKRPH